MRDFQQWLHDNPNFLEAALDWKVKKEKTLKINHMYVHVVLVQPPDGKKFVTHSTFIKTQKGYETVPRSINNITANDPKVKIAYKQLERHL